MLGWQFKQPTLLCEDISQVKRFGFFDCYHIYLLRLLQIHCPRPNAAIVMIANITCIVHPPFN